ncbi:uncharacterized protein LOC100904922 [Galendromus occidentalis]|uniref:Uncharacterized protein LOC100904922 n=1 Tax=Galendromus occidentalis TaxID=34638 RepID=A0AAJ7SIW4_9ACAR|nr:uncharacterized protein LOC100904922 [Galendromus occidentalis]
MGVVESLLCLVYRIYFYFRKPVPTSRFGCLYDLTSSSPFKNETIFADEEKRHEYPQAFDDRVQIFGQNNKGQLMLAGIQRLKNDRALVLLYIRLEGGTSFSLEDSVCVDSSFDDHFAAGGLKMTCLIPMRRWKMSFNGTMRNNSTGDLVHLKLVSVGNLMHGVADFQSYHDGSFLAEQLSRRLRSRDFQPKRIQDALKDLDIYHQRFSFSSKVFVDGLPEELFLFGYKTKGKSSSPRIKKSVIAFTEVTFSQNGLSTVLGVTDLRNVMDDFLYGYLNFPNRQQRKLRFASDVGEFFLPGKIYLSVGAENWESLRLAELRIIDDIQSLELHGDRIWRRNFRISQISFDGHSGHALISEATGIEANVQFPELPFSKILSAHPTPSKDPSQVGVIPFTHPAACNESLTGGKGSSLAILTRLAEKNKELFKVPRGVCVTTEAYKDFVSIPLVSETLDGLQVVCSRASLKEIREACDKAASMISDAPLPSQLENLLKKVLSPDLRYAVRSSACGEDSEETSAAGQMETILGVRGLDRIFRAVAKCWASQFSFVAVQYRRRYGQPLKVPMCVVVQEMVASEVAGVMFTVEPVSGDPHKIIITANFGLGESVVSATADPDTFVLRKVCGDVEFVEQNLGEKKLSIIMSGRIDSGGTENLDGHSRRNEACLNIDQILLLGRTALALEKGYASPRDTEWAFCNNVLFMLQARPVTSLDQIDTDFEYLHESDSGMDSEIDALSKANVGEVFGGSMSTLSLDVLRASLTFLRIVAQTWNGEEEFTYAKVLFLHNYYSQCFFPTYWPNLVDYTANDLMSRCFTIAMAGRPIDDECVIISNRNKRRYQFGGSNGEGSLQSILKFWRSEAKLRKNQAKFKDFSFRSSPESSWELFNLILDELSVLEEGFGTHEDLIFNSSISNMLMLFILARCNNGEWNNKVYSDFGKLSSSSKNVESASVPVSINLMAQEIQKEFGDDFAKMDVEDARHLLISSVRSRSTQLFREFLRDHGHRCLGEFDIHTKSWSMDQTPLIRTLQAMLSTKVESGVLPTTAKSDDDLINGLSIRIPFYYRPLLKLCLSRVRRGIVLREEGKSLCIKTNDILRKRFWELGELMVREGRLPEEDLLFHLSLTEICELLRDRSPKLLIRAIHRRRNQKTAASAIYPEHCAGLPLEALNKQQSSSFAAAKELRGTPVREGVVRAPARVILTLGEADQIQKGDILVTYATDIGWSPYFSLLSGIVTELGGLISHGAVIAREYGLPCIVGVQGATRAFSSGQEVVLDGSRGTIALVSVAGEIDSHEP